ncbi:unnamed protein product [Brassica oleracea]|uniref:uncharacterized protein LOC106329201 isoform X1 n=1 Tax=Brassica oleracea var. oleracea TaxID=109376 RepID=UPI0006A6D9A1|nr:PREDICTED: uncharacterized protein LOC106329201 isoform X1 [Brassica oleracea var. oleracea]
MEIFGLDMESITRLQRVQNEIIEEMRSHGLIGSHGFIVRLWILPSGLLLLKQALCLVSSNQSQRVELDMAKIRKGVLRLAQISARIETRIVDELYLDLASIHPAVSGSANFMLVVHLDNRNISGNGGYLDMVFGLGWTRRSHLLSIEELLGKYHFGADYYLSISILKAIKRNVFLKKKELLGIIKCWYFGRRLRRQHLY